MKPITSVSDQSNTIAINPYALDPDKTYVATVAASVKDVFGQTLGHEGHVTIHTSDFAPGAWAPSGGQPSVIPAGASVDLNFYATNLPGDAYRAGYARLTPLQMLGSPRSAHVASAVAELAEHCVRGARRNVQSVVRFPVQSRLGGLVRGARVRLPHGPGRAELPIRASWAACNSRISASSRNGSRRTAWCSSSV